MFPDPQEQRKGKRRFGCPHKQMIKNLTCAFLATLKTCHSRKEEAENRVGDHPCLSRSWIHSNEEGITYENEEELKKRVFNISASSQSERGEGNQVLTKKIEE